jgi:ribonuclease P protein component
VPTRETEFLETTEFTGVPMLPPAARLRRRAEFAATTRGGRRAGRGGVVVHLLTAQPTGSQSTPADSTAGNDAPLVPARVGFAVSRAVGNAVVRNRVRRRLRHLVRTRLDRLPAGSSLVVRALPAATHRTYQELGHDLDAALAAAASPRQASRRTRRPVAPAESGLPGRPGGTE